MRPRRPIVPTALAVRAIVAGVAVAPAAHAQAARIETVGGEPRIVVTASRSVRLTPERLTLLAVVEGTAEAPNESVQRADRKLQAVLEAARPFGGRATTALPYGVSTAPNVNNFPGAGAQAPYVARYTVRIPNVAVDQLLRVSAALIAAGASTAQAQGFEAAATDSVRRAQYADAIAQARRDAEALAAGVGGRLGAPVEVFSSSGPASPLAPTFVSFNRFEGPTNSPDVVVSSTVTVRYRLLLPDAGR